MVTEEKRKRRLLLGVRVAIESGMEALSGMMEVFSIFIQMHAACVCVYVCAVELYT